jgi:Ca-activated chloride channel family protein
VPLVVAGRYSGAPAGTMTVTGRTRDGAGFRSTATVERRDEPAVAAQWARARLRDLEDRYAAGERDLEKPIVETSLRFGVLCRFTAFVAVDSRVVNDSGQNRRVTQPVELPSGWEISADPAPQVLLASAAPVPPPAAGREIRPTFAPVQAAAGRMKTFAAVPSMMATGRGGGMPTSTPLSTEDMQRIAVVEAQRLRDGGNRPAYQRREMLADLASRLGVLLRGLTDPAYAPLRDLVAALEKNGDLETRWAEAIAVLTAFGGSTPAATPSRERKPFWKR